MSKKEDRIAQIEESLREYHIEKGIGRAEMVQLEEQLTKMGEKILKIGKELYTSGLYEGKNIQRKDNLQKEYMALTGKPYDLRKLSCLNSTADNRYVV